MGFLLKGDFLRKLGRDGIGLRRLYWYRRSTISRLTCGLLAVSLQNSVFWSSSKQNKFKTVKFPSPKRPIKEKSLNAKFCFLEARVTQYRQVIKVKIELKSATK